MRRLLLLMVFIAVFVFTLAANAPLSFILKRSGIVQQGVSWQQARGTAFHGQVTGLAMRGDPVGAVQGDFSLLRMVQGQPGHLIRWSGPMGQGSALATLSGSSVKIRKGRAAVTFDATRISTLFPAQDVSLRLSNVSIDANASGCRAASGDVTTDALSRISAVYGANWPDLDGSLSCVDGEIVVSVEGQAADGTRISAKSSLQGDGRLELWDVPENQTNALLLAGFTNEAGRFVYMQRLSNGESVQ
ncbi:type II secretion system protein N [Hyphomonas sp.]|uniref:type II secretion system protein N n=1 Tax=Hyphomonas sp. TaxID=87 RepID=UPI0035286166